MDEIIKYWADVRVVIGALGGSIGMFFYAQKNPEWVQKLYQKQRGLSMQGTEEVDRLKKKVEEMELDKRMTDKYNELIGKKQ